LVYEVFGPALVLFWNKVYLPTHVGWVGVILRGAL
jgi:hypothetical protein